LELIDTVTLKYPPVAVSIKKNIISTLRVVNLQSSTGIEPGSHLKLQWEEKGVKTILKIYIILQSIHSFGDIFHGGGIGESKVAFSIPAEIDAGRYPHPSLFKYVECEFV
jgi:hypothetical protein